MGATTHGYLHRAARLANQGEGYVRLRPNESTRYGSETLVAAVTAAAQSVQHAFPGGHPLRIGDLSSRRGGAHARHASHRSGRDVDLLFYMRDAGGLSAQGAAWGRVDEFGVSSAQSTPVFFDTARNWHLVRTLLLDEDARVKWIFVSNDLKARLLRYAAQHETSPKAIARAAWVLHQPSHGDPHADHFHVRVGCSAIEAQLGCRERAPFWPWLGDASRKTGSRAGASASDAELVRWLLAEEHVDQGGHVARGRLDAAAKPALVAGR